MALHFKALPMNYLLLGAKNFVYPNSIETIDTTQQGKGTMSVQIFSRIRRRKLPAETIVYMKA